jgi:septal ring factor EnvC (AmiA/AmiB activator)
MAAAEIEVVAQELSALGQRLSAVEKRLREVETVNTRLEEAAVSTARALEELSAHWDAVAAAMRRSEASEESA